MNSTTRDSGSRYYITYDRSSDSLYVSLPLEKKILKINIGNLDDDPAAVAGTGRPCVSWMAGPNAAWCGDGGEATKARMVYPKVYLLQDFFRTESVTTFLKLHDTKLAIPSVNALQFIAGECAMFLMQAFANATFSLRNDFLCLDLKYTVFYNSCPAC